MSARQRKATAITGNLEWLAIHGVTVTITWTRAHQFSCFVKRDDDDFHAHADTLDEAVRACAEHVAATWLVWAQRRPGGSS